MTDLEADLWRLLDGHDTNDCAGLLAHCLIVLNLLHGKAGCAADDQRAMG